jgi:hypothetical protein
VSFQNRLENLSHLGNRMFLRHVATRGGIGEELAPARKFVAELVEEFSAYIIEGDDLASPAEFFRRMVVGLDPISRLTAETRATWTSWQESPHCQAPFKPSMAVKICRTGELAFEPV